MTASDLTAVSPDANAIDAWRVDVSEVESSLGTSADDGLSGAVADTRLAEFGRNELVEKKQRPMWMLFVDQFTSPMILVLIGAAVVTFLINHPKDTVVILAIVVFNGVVGFVQEYRAGQAMDALKQMSSPQARVVRDGEVRLVPAAEVVPGDVLLLEQGDIVTADMRLTEAPGLRINEAPLTGESEPVAKVTEPLPEVSAATPADQRNMAFSGTAVTLGRARGLVVSTGMATAIGRIAELLQEGEDEDTPLQIRLGQLGKWLAIAAIVICAAVFGLGVARGEPAEDMFLVAVSLAVAAIPEGLPAVVTISLALGARRMAARRALVRRLPAVETLGSVSVICSDKTGTLTENRMLVERLWTPHGEYEVKAAFLLNFARLVEWPAASFASPHAPLVLAVLADDDVGDSIERGVRGKAVGSHPVQVVRISSSEDVAGSHIVFVSSSDPDRNRRVIKAALGKSVLTVGDASDFVQDGGIINFFIKDQRVRFAINRQAAENAGLRISSRLLRLARVVSSEGSGP